jgi:multiple inositol-polyphosphate phosphatase/2,3-bisphosphoglycerate 3-phosphatase
LSKLQTENLILGIVENYPDGTYEKARLRFAHAETLVPFTCLLGLFLEGSGMAPILDSVHA